MNLIILGWAIAIFWLIIGAEKIILGALGGAKADHFNVYDAIDGIIAIVLALVVILT